MKLNPKIYEIAAEKIASGEADLACFAIHSLICLPSEYDNFTYVLYVDDFSDYFNPRTEPGIWFGHIDYPKNRLARTLALLLMAEIVRETL